MKISVAVNPETLCLKNGSASGIFPSPSTDCRELFLDLNTFAEHSIASKVFVPLDRDQNAVGRNLPICNGVDKAPTV